MDENEILLSDILNFIKAVALREFRASGPQHYQHFEDILTLLKELEAKEADQHGNARLWLCYIEVDAFSPLSQLFCLPIMQMIWTQIRLLPKESDQRSYHLLP